MFERIKTWINTKLNPLPTYHIYIDTLNSTTLDNLNLGDIISLPVRLESRSVNVEVGGFRGLTEYNYDFKPVANIPSSELIPTPELSSNLVYCARRNSTTALPCCANCVHDIDANHEPNNLSCKDFIRSEIPAPTIDIYNRANTPRSSRPVINNSDIVPFPTTIKTPKITNAILNLEVNE